MLPIRRSERHFPKSATPGASRDLLASGLPARQRPASIACWLLLAVACGCQACGGPDALPRGPARDVATTAGLLTGGAERGGNAAPGTAAQGGVDARRGAAAPGDGAPPGADEPRPVELTKAASGRLPRTVLVSGTLAADEQVALAMKVAGRIERMPVDLGSRVRRGDLVARLAQPDFTLRVEQAENALEQARARLGLAPGQPDERVRPEDTAGVREADAQLHQAQVTNQRQHSLFRQQLISQQDLDAAEAAFQVAEARRQDALDEARNRIATLAQRRSELAIARQALTDSTLAAPFDGAIRERRAVAGDYVAVGQPIVVLVRTHPLRLRLAVPERDAAGLRAGQAVQLTVEGDQRVFTGRLARLSPAITEDNRTLMVEAEVPNLRDELRPGAFARALIVVEEARSAPPSVLVPASAVITFAGIDKVIGVDTGSRAREIEIKTGRRSGELVEVVDGLAAGEPVVIHPGNLVGGQRLRVVR